jgi:hypothetical protein
MNLDAGDLDNAVQARIRARRLGVEDYERPVERKKISEHGLGRMLIHASPGLRAAPRSGPSLALVFVVVIPLLPRVTGMKMENAWGRGSRGMIRCTARLSRRLRARERQLLERLPGTIIQGGSEVVHECLPDEVEDWQSLLSDVLRGDAA